MKTGRLACLFFASVGVLAVPLLARARSSSELPGENMVVFADDSVVADTVAVEAGRVVERLSQLLGMELPRSAISIVISLDDVCDKKVGEGNGVVRIFGADGQRKLQVNWAALPLLQDNFQRGCVRALCARMALMGAHGVEKGGDFRLPAWITEGLAVLAMQPEEAQEVLGRATLLARMETDLPLDSVLAELEGRQDLDANERALSAVLCRELLRAPASRERFLRGLAWGPETTARAWLREVLQGGDLDAWWRHAWEQQATQFPWLRLGYRPTLRWIRKGGVEPTENGRARNASPEEASMASPWFRPWFLRATMANQGPGRNEAILREVQARRTAAIAWFVDLPEAAENLARQDLLLWGRRRWGDDLNAPAYGRALEWFDRLSLPSRGGSPPAS